VRKIRRHSNKLDASLAKGVAIDDTNHLFFFLLGGFSRVVTLGNICLNISNWMFSYPFLNYMLMQWK